VRALPDPHAGVIVRGHTFYASPDDGASQWASTDDGRTWQLQRPAVVLDDPGRTQYVTSRIGFRTTTTRNGHERFQRTVDGGRHWQTLHPVLAGQSGA